MMKFILFLLWIFLCHLLWIINYLLHFRYAFPDSENLSNQELNLHKLVELDSNYRDLIEVPAIILGCTSKTCVDSGSTKSFIHASFLENFGSSTFDLIPLDQPMLVKMGNGETMICHNKVELPLQIGNDVYPFEFRSADKLLFDSILGMDFMKMFDVAIRPAKNTISIEKNIDIFDSVQKLKIHCFLVQLIKFNCLRNVIALSWHSQIGSSVDTLWFLIMVL